MIELTHKLNLRITAAEHAELKTAATDAGLSLSDYARRRVFGRVVIAATDATTIRELRRIGGLLKLTIDDWPGEAAAVRRVLDQLGAAIDRLAR
jgi:hypothetical protein